MQLERDSWGRLVLTDAAGCRHVGVVPIRAFPISAPRWGLALCSAVEGREILWIDRFDELPPELRRILEEELSRRHDGAAARE